MIASRKFSFVLLAAAAWLAAFAPLRAEDDAALLGRARDALSAGGYSIALDLFGRLDEAGNAEGSRDLGLMYWDGYGVDKDPARACDLFAKAEAAGDAKATQRLARCFDTGVGRPIDYTRAADLFGRAGERGAAESYCALARHYVDGLGVDKDPAKAADLCRKGADLGDAAAELSLAQMYLAGIGVAPDAAEGLRWLDKASRQDQPDASYLLGLHYWNGTAVTQDRNRAADLFYAAATHGSASAPAFLARYYYLQGFGTPKLATDHYEIKIEDGAATKSLFWGLIAAGNDPDADVRAEMVKHVRVITGIAAHLQDPVHRLIASRTWPVR